MFQEKQGLKKNLISKFQRVNFFFFLNPKLRITNQKKMLNNKIDVIQSISSKIFPLLILFRYSFKAALICSSL